MAGGALLRAVAKTTMSAPFVENIPGIAENSPANCAPENFNWPLAYEAENFLREKIATFLGRNQFATELAARMQNETGTDFFEWTDHLVLSPNDEAALRRAGFETDKVQAPNGEVVLHHLRATLPRVLLRSDEKPNPSVIALRPEFIADFLHAHNLTAAPEGEPFLPL